LARLPVAPSITTLLTPKVTATLFTATRPQSESYFGRGHNVANRHGHYTAVWKPSLALLVAIKVSNPDSAHDTTDQALTMSNCFDGNFSDFAILCNGKEWKFHRCFIAPQSKYFERVFAGTFKDGAERKVELREGDFQTVDRIVHYFYNFDYRGNCCGGRCNSQSAATAEVTAGVLLRLHVDMHCITEKYDIPGLRTLALEKFKKVTSAIRDSSYVLTQGTYATNRAALPKSGTSLRGLIVDAWLLGGCASALLRNDRKEFATIMSTAP
jgi:hypothetical protein